MAFQLVNSGRIISDDLSIAEDMNCYDTLGDPDFDYDRDELLHNRSAYEFVREQLSDAQRADLDVIDAFWQAHAKEFNADFAILHNLPKARRDKELNGWVVDESGNTPAIPRSHWWWWPIEDDNA